jgi:hypothetical protein
MSFVLLSRRLNGETIGLIGIHLDITEQKSRKNSCIYCHIAEKNINAVVVSDKQGKVEWANASLP